MRILLILLRWWSLFRDAEERCQWIAYDIRHFDPAKLMHLKSRRHSIPLFPTAAINISDMPICRFHCARVFRSSSSSSICKTKRVTNEPSCSAEWSANIWIKHEFMSSHESLNHIEWIVQPTRSDCKWLHQYACLHKINNEITADGLLASIDNARFNSVQVVSNMLSIPN